MREKLIIKYPEKSLRYFLPQTLAQKINNLTHYKNLTQQEPKTSASAVTCSDEIQQKNHGIGYPITFVVGKITVSPQFYFDVIFSFPSAVVAPKKEATTKLASFSSTAALQLKHHHRPIAVAATHQYAIRPIKFSCTWQ